MFSLLFIISLIREYEYVCLFTDEPSDSHVYINYNYLIVSTYDTKSYGKLTKDMFTTPLCAQITPGVVSFSFSEGVGYTVTGDKFFKRMGTAPFFVAVNLVPFAGGSLPGGVCSLKVDWSC